MQTPHHLIMLQAASCRKLAAIVMQVKATYGMAKVVLGSEARSTKRDRNNNISVKVSHSLRTTTKISI